MDEWGFYSNSYRGCNEVKALFIGYIFIRPRKGPILFSLLQLALRLRA